MDSQEDSTTEAAGKRNRGPCRICYECEDEGEIIAPCLCKGTQRWIHRDCLDRWRGSGFQRALTNCRECGFQYHLMLCREDGKGLSEGQQRLLQKMGTQSLVTFCFLQVLILIFGAFIRLLDNSERLVEVFNFPQEPGGEKIGDFWDAAKYHKTTYYVAGVLALSLIGGVIGSVYSCCTPRGRREFSGGGGNLGSGVNVGFFDAWACNICCEDCGRSCSHSCACDSNCCDLSALSCCDFGGGGSSECGDCLIVGVVIALALLVLVGIFMAIVAIVTAILRFAKQWAQLTQIRVLAKEYVVEDLAAPDEGSADEKQQDMSPAKHPPQRADTDQVQQQLAQDLGFVFGTLSHQPSAGYGSVV